MANSSAADRGAFRAKIVVDARVGWGSGIGRYIANTVPRVVDAMPDCRFDLFVGSDDVAAARAIVGGRDNAALVPCGILPFSLAEQVRLPALLRAYDFAWFTNYWVPLAFRGRFIAAAHDMLHQEPALFPASSVKRMLSRMTFQHIARHAEGLCFLSRFSRREFERRFGGPRRGVVTSCGIDHADWELFDPNHPPRKAPQLLVVAAAKKHKNFRIAVEAFARARIAPHWRLTIITPNDKLRSSIDLTALALASERVDFRQGISNDALRALYGETAILLMPSMYEGFGLPLAEGLQAGAQCISSTAAALVELGQGATVAYVDPQDLDGWVQAIESECARFDQGAVDPATTRANMQHAAQFRWDGVGDHVTALLRECITGSATGADRS